MDKKSSPSPKEVKKENDEEIKDFAETAMNELLGWYGYERLEMRRWAASRAEDGASPEQTVENPKSKECSWCHKCVTDSGALQQAGATFCSELCFSQSRRANFKRAKTCDWCRHVRHTVAYVDFQDGATQLQFCSDKCLNQYKMHIFCRETQAHLDLNPHLVSASSTSNLITPELWLKNCKSRSATPNSERSSSPNPEKNDEASQSRQSPLPLITVTPAAKLMKSKEKTAKSPEAKKETKTSKINLRKRRVSRCSATVTSQTIRQSTPKAQDMRMRSPSVDASSPVSSATISNSTLHSPPSNPVNPPIPPFPNPMFGMPPPFLEPHLNEHRPPMFPPRLPFMPHLPGMMHQDRPRLNPPLNFQGPMGQPPPVTVLIPYPVILPVPVPIPIPIPISAFLQAHCASKVKTEKTDLNTNDDSEGPLDFTMNSEKNKEDSTVSNNVTETNKDESPISEEATKRISEDRTTESVESNVEQTLPKFKITRLGNKMAKIVTKTRDSESSRPLRKRRRLVEVASEDDSLIPKSRKIVQV